MSRPAEISIPPPALLAGTQAGCAPAGLGNRSRARAGRTVWPAWPRGCRRDGPAGFPLVALWIGLVALSLPAQAHDIYSSWVEARLRADKLEVTVTLARSCAHDLLPDSRQLPPITPDNFATFAPRLRQLGPDLLEISAAGRTLSPVSCDVAISGDNDVTFALAYPAPARGPLRFVAQYLVRLVDGHVATIVLTNAAGADLGWSPVTMDQPVFRVLSLAAPPPGQKADPKK